MRVLWFCSWVASYTAEYVGQRCHDSPVASEYEPFGYDVCVWKVTFAFVSPPYHDEPSICCTCCHVVVGWTRS